MPRAIHFTARRWLPRLAAVVAFAGAWPLIAQGDGHAARPALRVLFIGNSYTYFNNLGDIVSGIAEGLSNGPTIEPALAVRGSASLKWHLANGTAKKQLADGPWDYVVLQEQSFLGRCEARTRSDRGGRRSGRVPRCRP